jgi:hypothetical protein
MTTTVIPAHGLLITPIGTPAAAETAAAEYCAGRGLDEWDIAELRLADRVRRAWWGGPEVGFVGRDYPDALETAVVDLPEQLLTEEVL